MRTLTLRAAFRRALAVAALLGVAVLPLRASGLCEMPRGTTAAAEASEHAEHSGHAGHAVLQEDADRSAPADAQQETCPDLAGCAVLALGTSASVRHATTAPADSPIASVAALLDGPATSLDPPPPRR